MPLYDYHCKECDQDFFIERNISDPRNDVVCSQCTSEVVYRVFANVGLTQLPTRGANSLSKVAVSEKPSGDMSSGDNSEGAKPSPAPADSDGDSSSKKTVKTSDASVTGDAASVVGDRASGAGDAKSRAKTAVVGDVRSHTNEDSRAEDSRNA